MPEIDRRDFLRIVGLSAGAAATVACREPVEKIVPYLNRPEEVTPGIASFYASTCRECQASCGLIVKTREGRPIKVDGNPADPVSHGRLCARGQASLSRTYDPSRLAGPLKRDASGALVPTTWEDGIATLAAKLLEHSGKVAFLGGLETGTLDGLIDDFLAAIGSPNRVRFEPFAHEALRRADQQLFGTASVPQFRLDRADLVVSFGADWEETWLSPVLQQVRYAQGRRVGQGYAVYVGPRLGLSGSEMDEWIAPRPGSEIQLVLALVREVALVKRVDLGALAAKLRTQTTADAAEQTGIAVERIRGLARRIADAQAPVALPPGNELQGTNATGIAAAVQLLNYASGAIGTTVVFGPDHNVERLGSFADLKNLAGRLRSKAIGMLLVHGANPVYAAPALGFAEAMQSAYTVSFASAEDETTSLADLVLPDHTPYEAWGDPEPLRGVRLLQQPTVRPLMDTRATGDVLLEVARALGVGERLPAGSFKDALAARWADVGFEGALANGGVFTPAPARNVTLAASAGAVSFENAKLAGEGDLTLLVYPSLSFYDGRSARIPMLQELPNPVTKLVWGSYAELHPETAAKLGVELGDVLRVTTEAGSLELPAFVHETLRPDVVAIEAGQGHQPVEPGAPDPDRLKLREQVGVNAYSLLSGTTDSESGALAWLSARARVEKTGRKALMPRTQATFDQEGRGIAQATSMAAVLGLEPEGHPAPAHDEHHEPPYADAMHLETVDFDPAADARSPDYRWGMVIDLDACTGCNACVNACVQENNIFLVGEQFVRQGREMQWIRLERYVEHHGDEIEVRQVPMLCQHCGSAPCEPVCPVYATYHNQEGLNVMVPNRCIGTRYCSNNCSYKVRRFNYFPYDQWVRPPEHLRFNPDVMVRSKGVMEKCTFCVQKINAAKDQAALEGRVVREGEVTPACAQTCPSQAISFGNHKDPASKVSKLRADGRAYWALHHLNTRPAVTYLKSIRRGETGKA